MIPHGLVKLRRVKRDPSKKTIIRYSRALELNTFEIAYLFDNSGLDIAKIFNKTINLLSTTDLNELLYKIVNDLLVEIGYIAALILLIDNTDKDKIRFTALTNSNISEMTIKCLDRPIGSLYLSLSRDLSNLTVKAIKENKIYLTHYTHEFTVPAVPKIIADAIQKQTGDKSNIIFPLCTEDEPFGAIVYVKGILDNFKNEVGTLKIISRLIAVSIKNAKKIESLYNASHK